MGLMDVLHGMLDLLEQQTLATQAGQHPFQLAIRAAELESASDFKSAAVLYGQVNRESNLWTLYDCYIDMNFDLCLPLW